MADESPKRNVEDALKPASFAEFLGQDKVKERLQLAIEAAKLRNEPVEHILLFGPPGVGKATLASVVAKAMSVNNSRHQCHRGWKGCESCWLVDQAR